jgi:C_GCAxxG_C_C family probable redox protein
VSESKNIQSELIPKIATGFCGGLSRTCGICGALSGAIMALNLFYGRNLPDESVETCYIKVQQLIEMFENKFVSTDCKQLIGCDLGTKEGQNTFMTNNLVDQCINYTEEATRIVMSILEDA